MRASEIRPEIHQILSTAATSAGAVGVRGDSRVGRAVGEAADSVVGLLVQNELVEADPEPFPGAEGGEDGLAAQVQALTDQVRSLTEFARQRAGYTG